MWDFFILVAIVCIPVSIGIAWWFLLNWYSEIPSKVWHRRILLSGIVSAMLNLIMFGILIRYSDKFTSVTRQTFGTVGLVLITWGFIAGEIAGNFLTRIAFQVWFVFCLYLWIPKGV